MNLELIKSIGEATTKKLNKKGLKDIGDLLQFFPISYTTYSSNNLNEKNIVLNCIIKTKISTFYSKRKIIITTFYIESNNNSIKVTAFNQAYIKQNFKISDSVCIKGKYDNQTNTLILSSIRKSENQILDEDIIVPIYSHITGLSSFKINKIINNAMDLVNVQNLDLYKQIHNPSSKKELDDAIYKMKYFEFYEYMKKLTLTSQQTKIEDLSLCKIISIDDIQHFLNKLPFELTGDQLKAIYLIVENFKSPYKSSQLLLGDVGCGKTIVALCLCYVITKLNYQVVIMAPTSILATQIYEQVLLFYKETDICLLTSKVHHATKKRIKQNINLGICKVIVATHSVLQDDVVFDNLGLVIIDEQHRFGVNQRQNLLNKSPHCEYVAMSATPIPRTLAQTFFNVLDVIEIKTKPADRKNIKTTIYNSATRNLMMETLEKHLKNNHQVFVVAPNIEEGEVKNVTNVVDVYNSFVKRYDGKYNVGLIHGYLKNKQNVMLDFKNGLFDILVATSVIEVGVDIQNASCIMILNAERFGLATLHQMRGRVGRNDLDCECLLYSKTDNDLSMQRLNLMCEFNDGFELAKRDLVLRGSGDFFTTKQSGNADFKIFDYVNDINIANKVIDDIKKKYD